MDSLCKILLFVDYLVGDQDMSRQPPSQELVAKDLHGVEWRFRHIFRGIISLLPIPFVLGVV